MKQKAFDFVTWAVVGVAVLSSMWLAWQAPLSDLRAAKALDDAQESRPSRTESKVARQQAAAASGVTRSQ
jgi:hypothetical protein